MEEFGFRGICCSSNNLPFDRLINKYHHEQEITRERRLLPRGSLRCNSMRQPRFERGTFGSGGGTGQRPPTLAVVVSSTYASRASASASQRRPRCYHRCYRGSLLRRCLGAATPCTCITWPTFYVCCEAHQGYR